MFWWSRVEESCLQQWSFLGFVCVVIAFIPCQVAMAQRCDTVVSNVEKWCCSLVSFGQVAYLDISFQSCGVCSYICHGGDHSKWSIFFAKKEEKMSLENLQTLSKLKKICVHNCFFKKNMCAATQKSCARIFFLSLERFWRFSKRILPFFIFYFFVFFLKNDIKQTSLCEFGVNLEILQARSKLICFHCFLLFHCFFGKEEWVWSELGESSNSPQTRTKLIFYFYFIFFWGEQRNEFGVSLEIFQTLSKLTSNSLQTQMISFFRVFFLYCCFSCLFGKDERFSLQTHMFSFFLLSFSFLCIYFFGQEEGVWIGFGDSPNSLQTHMFFLIVFSLEKRDEWLWRFSKLSPNSPQTRSKLKGFHFFLFYFFFEKRNEFGASLESLQTLSKLSANSIQIHVFFCYVTTEKKLLVQEALQSSASSACSTVCELLETSLWHRKNRNLDFEWERAWSIIGV